MPAPSDRRARKIVATDDGRALLATYEERVAAVEAEILAGLEAPEAATPTALISQLAMAVHRAQPGSSPCEAMDHLP